MSTSALLNILYLVQVIFTTIHLTATFFVSWSISYRWSVWPIAQSMLLDMTCEWTQHAHIHKHSLQNTLCHIYCNINTVTFRTNNSCHITISPQYHNITARRPHSLCTHMTSAHTGKYILKVAFKTLPDHLHVTICMLL